MVQRSKSHSAPVPLQLSVIREETGSEGEGVTQTDRQEPQNGEIIHLVGLVEG